MRAQCLVRSYLTGAPYLFLRFWYYDYFNKPNIIWERTLIHHHFNHSYHTSNLINLLSGPLAMGVLGCVMIDVLVDWNWHSHGFWYFDFVCFLHVVWYDLLNVVWYLLFDFLGYQLVDWDWDWVWYLNVDCVRLWYWNLDHMRYWYSYSMWHLRERWWLLDCV